MILIRIRQATGIPQVFRCKAFNNIGPFVLLEKALDGKLVFWCSENHAFIVDFFCYSLVKQIDLVVRKVGIGDEAIHLNRDVEVDVVAKKVLAIRNVLFLEQCLLVDGFGEVRL